MSNALSASNGHEQAFAPRAIPNRFYEGWFLKIVRTRRIAYIACAAVASVVCLWLWAFVRTGISWVPLLANVPLFLLFVASHALYLFVTSVNFSFAFVHATFRSRLRHMLTARFVVTLAAFVLQVVVGTDVFFMMTGEKSRRLWSPSRHMRSACPTDVETYSHNLGPRWCLSLSTDLTTVYFPLALLTIYGAFRFSCGHRTVVRYPELQRRKSVEFRQRLPTVVLSTVENLTKETLVLWMIVAGFPLVRAPVRAFFVAVARQFGLELFFADFPSWTAYTQSLSTLFTLYSLFEVIRAVAHLILEVVMTERVDFNTVRESQLFLGALNDGDPLAQHWAFQHLATVEAAEPTQNVHTQEGRTTRQMLFQHCLARIDQVSVNLYAAVEYEYSFQGNVQFNERHHRQSRGILPSLMKWTTLSYLEQFENILADAPLVAWSADALTLMIVFGLERGGPYLIEHERVQDALKSLAGLFIALEDAQKALEDGGGFKYKQISGISHGSVFSLEKAIGNSVSVILREIGKDVEYMTFPTRYADVLRRIQDAVSGSDVGPYSG